MRLLGLIGHQHQTLEVEVTPRAFPSCRKSRPSIGLPLLGFEIDDLVRAVNILADLASLEPDLAPIWQPEPIAAAGTDAPHVGKMRAVFGSLLGSRLLTVDQE